MNKQIRIGLIALITIILLLVLTVPGLANKPKPFCAVRVLTIDDAGNVNNRYWLEGDLNAYWKKGTLYNECTGQIPFGEKISEMWSYASFETWCERLPEVDPCKDGPFFIDKEDYTTVVSIFDPRAEDTYFATYYELTVWENGDFFYYKEYAP